LDIRFAHQLPDSDAFFGLFVATGWNNFYKLSGPELLVALNNSWYTISAYDGSELIGFARIVCDGIVHAMIYDLIVAPEYQNKGIGSLILNKVIDHCVKNDIRDIQLFCAEGMKEFYSKHGFFERPNDAPGMEIRNRI
jgi:ribosomal protein S18 acetylase RimI-like enzyme